MTPTPTNTVPSKPMKNTSPASTIRRQATLDPDATSVAAEERKGKRGAERYGTGREVGRPCPAYSTENDEIALN